MSGRQERRAFDASLRANAKRSISGHASIFNVEYDVGPFREIIRPGTFAESIKTDDVRALWGHDANIVLGRNKAGTLLLKEDSVGLAFTIDAPSWAEPHLETIRRGDISQASFAFTVDGSDGENFQRGTNGEKDLRVITKARLWDVSPVAFPASPATDVSVRALETYETWLSRPRRSPEWHRKALEAMEADVGRDRLSQRTKSKPPRPAPAADDYVILTGRDFHGARYGHREKIEPTAYHESGHCVTALALGFEVESVCLDWRRKGTKYAPAGGICSYRGASSTVFLGGHEAERFTRPGRPHGEIPIADLREARRLAGSAREVTRACQRARRIVLARRQAVEAIARKLMVRGQLDGREVEAIYRRHTPRRLWAA